MAEEVKAPETSCPSLKGLEVDQGKKVVDCPAPKAWRSRGSPLDEIVAGGCWGGWGSLVRFQWRLSGDDAR